MGGHQGKLLAIKGQVHINDDGDDADGQQQQQGHVTSEECVVLVARSRQQAEEDRKLNVAFDELFRDKPNPNPNPDLTKDMGHINDCDDKGKGHFNNDDGDDDVDDDVDDVVDGQQQEHAAVADLADRIKSELELLKELDLPDDVETTDWPIGLSLSEDDEPDGTKGVLDPIDIQMVMDVGHCSYATAVRALKDHDNDVVNAILDLPLPGPRRIHRVTSVSSTDSESSSHVVPELIPIDIDLTK